MNPSPESQKIADFRALLSTIVLNTKKNMDGKAANQTKEAKLISKHLALILGRPPTEREVFEASPA